MTAPDMRGAAARHARARRQGRRRRSASHRDGEGGRRARRDPSGRRRGVPARDGARAASSAGASTARASSADASGWDEIERARAPLHARRVAAHAGVPAATIERLALRVRRRRRRRSATRASASATRRFGTLATWATDLLNIVAGRLGAVGGAMFTTPAFDIVELLAPWSAATATTAGEAACAGCPRRSATSPPRRSPRRSRRRARARFARWSRSPAIPVLSVPNGRPPRRGAREARLHGLDRHLRERDHAPRRRHPAARAGASPRITSTSVFANVVGAQHRALVAAGRRARRGRARRLGDPARAHRAARRRSDRRAGGSTACSALAQARRAPLDADQLPDLLAAPRARTATASCPWSTRAQPPQARRRAPHGIDLGPLRAGRRARVFHRDGAIHLAARRIARGDRASSRASARARPPAGRAPADRPPRAAHQQLLDAQRARARRGPRALRALRPSRRRRAATGVRDGETAIAREPRPPRRGARQRHRRDAARRREPAARLGPRAPARRGSRSPGSTRASPSTTGPTIASSSRSSGSRS